MIKVLIKIISGYYFFNLVFYIFLNFAHKIKNKSKLTTYQYIKEIPLDFNTKSIKRIRIVSQFVFMIFSTSIIVFAILYNLSPFGTIIKYDSAVDHKFISEIGPNDRVKKELLNKEKITIQQNDIVYFSTSIPTTFDNAIVRITFQNRDQNQTLELGFQDQPIWHYETKLIDVPFLNSISWNRVGEKPFLYQNKLRFSSVADFLHNLPKDALIGTYDTSMDIGRIGGTQIPDYQPKSEDTIIDVPLRGKHTMYVYVKDEPFKMVVVKQDLNWYQDPDTLTVKIYKGNDLVHQTIADDDGIIDNSRKVVPNQELLINNPGKELPESGVYKIEFDTSEDTIIKKISTNLHKIVFQGPLFLASNKTVYKSVINSTTATTLYTNALALGMQTSHTSGLQKISVGNESVNLNTIKTDRIIIPKDEFTKVVLPKNDVIINGYMGYFSFDPDSFFLPTPYRVIPITSKEDLEIVDFVLTDYIPSKKIGDWQVSERTYDLRTAYIKNKQLNWVIKAPNLKENKNEIIIKNIEIVYIKKSLF